jgi:hypothetical protein
MLYNTFKKRRGGPKQKKTSIYFNRIGELVVFKIMGAG